MDRQDIRKPDSNAPFGLRVDGTPKGKGYLGLIDHKSGSKMSEFSVGVDLGEGEIEIPTIVPTLSKPEIRFLQNIDEGQEIPKAIMDKAVRHARERISKGLSPFKD